MAPTAVSSCATYHLTIASRMNLTSYANYGAHFVTALPIVHTTHSLCTVGSGPLAAICIELCRRPFSLFDANPVVNRTRFTYSVVRTGIVFKRMSRLIFEDIQLATILSVSHSLAKLRMIKNSSYDVVVLTM